MSGVKRVGRYPAEVRERAVRMVRDHEHEYPSQWKAIQSISKKLGVNHETLRIWVRRGEVDSGGRPGLTTDERARIRQLERENKELRRANEILKSASAFFGAELDRQSKKIVAFIDAHRGMFGVEPICEVLCEYGAGIALNTYHVAKKRPPSARSVRHRELKIEIQRVFDENLFVYGADKIWTQFNRENYEEAKFIS